MRSSEKQKKVHIETWGCQMNVADAERMLLLLEDENYLHTTDAEEADLIILNTCNIREKAKHKVLSRLGRIKEIKERHPELKVIVAGCVAQAEGEKLLKSAPVIDALISPSRLKEIPKIIQDMQQSRKATVALGFETTNESEKEQTKVSPTLTGKNEISRFVNIIHGCNNFCTFCIVPFTRGRELSRPPKDIVAETKLLVENGTKEVFLLGQNVNSYGLDLVKKGFLTPDESKGPFVELLEEIAKIPELQRLRFTTSNPHDFKKPLADLFQRERKLAKYIHLPLQSGNNRILKKMNRKIEIDQYFEHCAWLREAVPDIAISTDFIVGFPGETEEEFEDTLSVVEKIGFSFIYAFKYSPRTGTVAAKMKDQIPEDVKENRLARLNELQDRITIETNEKEIGCRRQVLFLYESKKVKGSFYGRTEHFRLVRVSSGRSLTGKLLDVEITNGNKTALEGILV